MFLTFLDSLWFHIIPIVLIIVYLGDIVEYEKCIRFGMSARCSTELAILWS